ncbi:cytochrome c oxidase subunit I [Aureliella helgolandensis]|uniref:Alternative cytochrome c oxidase subunit 1 n=1 Tax=Aureliella helgolandensis TaxID=2527968 RepID=A0A518GH74_9BACT|nr:cbb3-type cytochrome c oxidase subunit I [Aureliella helgolandensis]QDV27942.1 Alternative cytochrome c oxidase subunit 1 [Aureliella helgolandensis]
MSAQRVLGGIRDVVTTYVLATDHKTVGLQFLFSSLIWFFVGGTLAWATQQTPILIYFVAIPALSGALGSYLIPLMIGADDLAYPTLSLVSHWLLWPAFLLVAAGMLVPQAMMPYAVMSHSTVLHDVAVPGESWIRLQSILGEWSVGEATQWLWCVGLICAGLAWLMVSVNFITTIAQCRAPGMFLFRMPLTVWGLFSAAILQLFTWPVLVVGAAMQLVDALLGTSFYWADSYFSNSAARHAESGQPLHWQELNELLAYPMLGIIFLPALGMISDVIATFSRRSLFGYRALVLLSWSIASLGVLVVVQRVVVWGESRIGEFSLGIAIGAMLVAGGVHVFHWLATLWGGRIEFRTPMLFALGFISLFTLGGLAAVWGILTTPNVGMQTAYSQGVYGMASLAGVMAMAFFAGIYFWFPKMFGRQMSEFWGKVHFALTFVFLQGAFVPTHLLGGGSLPRGYVDSYRYELSTQILPLNRVIAICVLATMASQLIFILNFLCSVFWGQRVGRNPWNSNTLEWAAPSPPGRGNFDFQPWVYRGAYQYGNPAHPRDFQPQTEPPGGRLASGQGGLETVAHSEAPEVMG